MKQPYRRQHQKTNKKKKVPAMIVWSAPPIRRCELVRESNLSDEILSCGPGPSMLPGMPKVFDRTR